MVVLLIARPYWCCWYMVAWGLVWWYDNVSL